MHREGEGWDSLERGGEGVVLLLLLRYLPGAQSPTLAGLCHRSVPCRDVTPKWPQTLPRVSAGSLCVLSGSFL